MDHTTNTKNETDAVSDILNEAQKNGPCEVIFSDYSGLACPNPMVRSRMTRVIKKEDDLTQVFKFDELDAMRIGLTLSMYRRPSIVYFLPPAMFLVTVLLVFL